MSRNIQCIFLLFKKFLIYLVCVPGFKSINSSFLFRKRKYGGDIFTPTRRKRLQGQNKLEEIELIELLSHLIHLYTVFYKLLSEYFV